MAPSDETQPFHWTLLDRGSIPDFLLRPAIRYLCRERLASISADDLSKAQDRKSKYIEGLKERPIAIHTDKANEQHYEVRMRDEYARACNIGKDIGNDDGGMCSSFRLRIENRRRVSVEFHKLALGPRLKYSSALWSEGACPQPAVLARRFTCSLYLFLLLLRTVVSNNNEQTIPIMNSPFRRPPFPRNPGVKTLQEAEVSMLDLYLSRSKVQDGMAILDLGCGWGSGCLYYAEKFPNSQVTAISNSNSQREYIMSVARERGLKNLKVVTGDVNDFDFEKAQFDRIISIEMFEHMKNYEQLFKKISTWLKSKGLLFIHIFLHTKQPVGLKWTLCG
ncbi:hypothetical protein BC936DRAFT_147485 [Jimgerdemannia flammicorona]|uniref:S-adenosyl-L-methionine-dependent methyltransferase n=1 Tax=Jimgerdemannia flammicorona TaxID=994334 RepID=A0A433D563_9FUNG|nr:hypothetical protein BC936DRAFT_147485 [Jimgerdemannia flammicorona]